MQFKLKLSAALGAILLPLVTVASGCTSAAAYMPPPIPPAYYDAIEVQPIDLVHAYFLGYGEIWGPKQKYNNQIFVFKDQLIDAWVVRELDQGWIWMDMIKCPVVNVDYMRGLKIGDRIDVVGTNLGPPDDHVPQLAFSNCYVLKPGALQIPAGTGSTIVVGY